MKLRNKVTKKLIFIILAIFIIVGATNSLVLADSSKNLILEYFRYNNGGYKDGYALNTNGSSTHHPIYQILSDDNKTNFYCLNAKVGDAWTNGHISTTEVVYNKTYDLERKKDEIENLSDDVYKNVVKNNYDQIVWLLDNIYIPGENESENLNNKRALLEKAGIYYTTISETGFNGETINNNGYKYVGNNYSFVTQGRKGYFYYDKDRIYRPIEVPDELIESVQQAAIWYFTNYLNNDDKDESYNAYVPPTDESGKNWLLCSNGSENTNSHTWKNLSELYKEATDVDGYTADVGEWYQEIATVLYDYLVDTARAYTIDSTAKQEPLSIEQQTALVSEKQVDGKNYYVLGPITITESNTKAYTIEDSVKVKDGDQEIADTYISDIDGNKEQDQIVKNYIGDDKSFYIAVQKSLVRGSNLKILFEGSYQTVEKLLWTATGTEQPVVEVTPKPETFTLEVTATIKKEFDLALRKIIKSVNNTEIFSNEEGRLANRKIQYTATDIATNSTATYNHRKDPVVVKKGDVITYSISVYNEGDIEGYALEITDKLPEGLEIDGALTGTLRGTYTSLTGEMKEAEYTYSVDQGTNTITITNETKNILEAYGNGNDLACETIDINCKVTQEPSLSNIYLINIAYISKEYNQELGQEVKSDRDSSTEKIPEADQKIEEDRYNGYHGGNNKNEDNTKDVYKDGTNNNDYFPGREDDDDFEIVVIQPKEFDLALQKYISKITSNGVTREGRQGPIINTKDLADGVADTASYTLDKNPISVKSEDYVTYTFNVYNEGEVDGYVNKITDNIPTGLQFVYQKNEDGKTLIVVNSDGTSSEIEVGEEIYQLVENNSYWSIDATDTGMVKDTYNNESTISITCDVDGYLDETSQDKLLSAYQDDSEQGYDGSGLDSIYVTVVLRVSAPNGKGIEIRNEAAITEAQDTDGNKQDATDSKLKDRDSQVDEWLGKDGDKKYQDDEDYDRVILEKIDLALIKFIAAVSEDVNIENGEYLTQDKNIGSKTNPYDRADSVDSKELKTGTKTDAVYNRVKTPLIIPPESYVLYDIRVYNEGETDVYAGEVTDYLPEYLDFVSCEFNDKYGWKQESDGKTIRTTYLGYNEGNNETNLLKAFDKENDDEKGSGLDYRDLQVLCKLNDNTPTETKLINSAEITKYEDENGNDIPEDIDSEPENLPDDEKNKEERHEDDDDWEVVQVEEKKVDLALTKFIAAVSEDVNIENGEYLTANKNVGNKDNPYDRAPSIDSKELKAGTKTDADYKRVKTPLVVPAQSYVLYDIRVYNEGETDVYAGEVTDYLPDYLDYVSCEFNDKYGWKQESDGKTIKTTYLGYNEGNNTDNLLKAFDKENDDEKGSGLDYRDLQILCKVNDKAPTATNLVNSAEITKYEDEKGKEFPKDVDSESDNIKDKNKEERYEDDDDWEVVLIKTFDLSLLKYVSTVYVTEDGNTTTTQTGNTGDDSKDIMPKVEIHRKKVNSTIVKFGYTIKITNEGDIAGYAKEITDYVPDGLKFYEEDNEGWTDEGNNVISTRLLENTLLQPGESAQVTVILRWINGSDNLGQKINIAEISEDYNDENIPDRDSTPDDKVEGEDDIDDAPVLLSISTGLAHNFIMYATYGLIISIVLATGIVVIKKYVL